MIDHPTAVCPAILLEGVVEPPALSGSGFAIMCGATFLDGCAKQVVGPLNCSGQSELFTKVSRGSSGTVILHSIAEIFCFIAKNCTAQDIAT